MKIAVLQFAPELGQLSGNIKRADELLANVEQKVADVGGVDWLILPEMALTGYNFSGRQQIEPFLEPTAAGKSSEWAKTWAAKWACNVSIGYPELPDAAESNDNDKSSTRAPPAYNTIANFNKSGELLFQYRKTFLYVTDAPWATAGPGFFSVVVPNPAMADGQNNDQAGRLWADRKDLRVAQAICMDLNPDPRQPISDIVSPNPGVHPDTIDYSIPAVPFHEALDKCEIGSFCQAEKTDLIIVTTAWLATTSAFSLDEGRYLVPSTRPDIESFNYWVSRFAPLYRKGVLTPDQTCILVISDRCGQEGPVTYAGTSCVLKIQKSRIAVYEAAGVNEERCMIVDLDQKPAFEISMSK